MKVARYLVVAVATGLVFAACTARTESDDDDGGSTNTATGSGLTTSASSTGSGSGGQPGTATVADACAGLAAHELACSQSDFDEAACTAAEACFRLMARDDAEQPLLNCYAGWSTNPDCDGLWCTEVVATSLAPSPEHLAHQQRCDAWVARCGGTGGDICRNPITHWEPAVVALLAPCFDMGCPQSVLETCVEDTVGSYLAQCGGELGRLL
jgi:hypothetical protein